MKKDFLALCILFIVTSIVFLPIFQIPYLYDDFDFLFTWNSIQDVNHIPQLLMGETPRYHEGVYRPIRSLLYIASFHLFHHNIFFYHLQALLLYAASTALIYFITKQLSEKRLLSLLTALIFALLPIHVDNVANLTASFDLAGIVFFLASFYCFQLFLQRKKLRQFIFSSVFAGLAYLTYEITLSLSLLLLLYAWYKKKKVSLSSLFWIMALPLSYGVLRAMLIHTPNRGPLLDHLAEKLTGAITHMATFLLSILFPSPLASPELSSFRGMLLFDQAPIVFSPTYPYTLHALAGCLLLLGIGLVLLKKRSIIGLGIGWYFISLLSVLPIAFQSSPVYQTQILYSRYAILASFGSSLVLGSILYSLIISSKNTALTLYFRIVGLTAFFVLLSYYALLIPYNINRWRDPRPLFIQQLLHATETPAKHNDLGVLAASYDQYEKALTEFQKALVLNPSYKRAEQNKKKLCETLIATKHSQKPKLCQEK